MGAQPLRQPFTKRIRLLPVFKAKACRGRAAVVTQLPLLIECEIAQSEFKNGTGADQARLLVDQFQVVAELCFLIVKKIVVYRYLRRANQQRTSIQFLCRNV